MNFGRPMVETPGVLARSNIRLVKETHLGDDPLDREVCRAANEAAKSLFLGNSNPSVPPIPVGSPEDVGGVGAKEPPAAAEPGAPRSAAIDGAIPDERLALVDCSLYSERHLPPSSGLIQPGDLVVVFESFNDLNFVYATPDSVFSNRNGHFHHNDFLGRPFGCKIRYVVPL